MGDYCNIANKLDWYQAVSDYIDENLEDFISVFYAETEAKKVSGETFSMDPCPVCGHKKCCRISHGNMVKCFSCDWKGTYINSWTQFAMDVKGLSYFSAIKKLEEYCRIPFPAMSAADIELHKRQHRQQTMLSMAERFFHDKLINEGETVLYNGTTISPFKYIVNIRRHSEETVKDFAIGFSKDYIELKASLIAAGFDAEEIKETKLQSIPSGVIVYFYHHPVTRDIIRVNIKNPFGVKAKFTDGNGNYVESDDVLEGYSNGDKILYCGPKFSFKLPVVLVEGENDEHSVYEREWKNVGALGGNPPPEMLDILARCEKEIYTFFDNDDVGDKYRKMINDAFPDKIVKNIEYDRAFNDPDDYFKLCQNALSMKELMDSAVPMTTDKYRVSHDGNVWRIQDRLHAVEFIIKKRGDKGQLTGQANLYDEYGKLKTRIEDTALVKCRGQMNPFSFYLSDEIESFFNTGLEQLPFKELADKYNYSSRKNDIISMLAGHLYSAEDKADEMVVDLKRLFRGSDYSNQVIDKVLIEFNNLKNANAIKEGSFIPKMKLAQYYNLQNNDAYFYYTRRKDDGDAQRAIPYLLKNDGTSIRLDLLRRKDKQCMLLVDNKYELPFEVPTAIFDATTCSLQDTLVTDFENHKIPIESIEPRTLLKECEAWIRRFYYTKNEDLYKLLSMWAYGTYFYVMFQQYPYLFINGEKGSGKTILNNILTTLSFNARTVVDTSEASLFRMAAVEGGTILLDEQETMTSRTAGSSTPFGPILKGGYESGVFVSRYNLEKGTNDLFDPFCPKVISNIFGLEDIIADRCIPVNTYQLAFVSKDLQIEDPKYYMENDQGAYKNITSRICFSALTFFQDLNAIYRDKNNLFETTNARLSQILTPILAIAKLADRDEVAAKKASLGLSSVQGEYEMAFMEYFKTTIQFHKNEVDEGTPEGIIKRIVHSIAMELAGKTEKEYVLLANRKYTEPIVYNMQEGWFELNVLHFKCFVEESMPGERVFSRHVPKWLKTCFDFDKNEIKRKLVRLENEDLIKELQGVRSMKVNFYRFYIKDFVKSDFLEEKEPDQEPSVEEESDGTDLF